MDHVISFRCRNSEHWLADKFLGLIVDDSEDFPFLAVPQLKPMRVETFDRCTLLDQKQIDDEVSLAPDDSGRRSRCARGRLDSVPRPE